MIRAMRRDCATEGEIADDVLLQRLSAGDPAAFTVLYRRKQPAIYRFALHMGGNAEVAEDVTQEVFMALVRDPKRFDPSKGNLTGFLFGIARNHLRKRWECDRRLVGFSEGEHLAQSHRPGVSNANGLAHVPQNGNRPAESADRFAASELAARVRHAIATLPEGYREVVALCELEEMSYEEAAAALNCPVGTIRSRLHRAKALLVEKLRDIQPTRATAVGREG
jgi:RNA polymerase sigma-70 factor (ECF subfamily)